MQKLRYSDKLRAIENGGEASRLFAEWIEVTQSVDVNFNLEMRASVHAIAQEQNIRERDAAVKLADQLADEPELAAMFVSGRLDQQGSNLEQLTVEHAEL